MTLIPNTIKSAKRTLVILTLAFSGCRGPVPQVEPTPEAISIRLLADNATAPLLRDLVNQYRPPGTLISWDIQVGEAPTVMAWLESDKAPYALLSYLPTPEDLSGATAQTALWRTPVGHRGVAIVAHPEISITDISAQQLRGIYQGQITNWSALGGPSFPITVVARDDNSSDARLIQDIVLGDRRTVRSARMVTTGQAMIDLVKSLPGAIGYVSVGYLDASVKTLAVEGILPTPASLANEQYPIRSPMVFVGRSEPGNDPYRAFFAWVQSPEGQAIVGQKYGGLAIGR